jgi:glycerol-3-phosphate acyltransferase PlsX
MANTISLDAMGGDFGPAVVVPAALSALKKHDDLNLILVGDQAKIEYELEQTSSSQSDRLKIQHATQVVEMNEAPAQALRSKKDSSMRVAINLVKEDQAQACVSAGNTGALMATARYVLHTLAGIDRPAINTTLPALSGGHTHMLDLGANVDCKAENLFQFAVMGSVLASAVDDLASPRVGLLNVGSEAIKGNDQVKEANILLMNSALNYIGYVEGDDIFCGEVDVIACDGFVGNVSLKTSEGVAKLISSYAKKSFTKNLYTKFIALLATPILNEFKNSIDPRRYNGASLLGLKGIVIKSHGGADAFSFEHAISIAYIEAKKGVPTLIDKQLENYLA